MLRIFLSGRGRFLKFLKIFKNYQFSTFKVKNCRFGPTGSNSGLLGKISLRKFPLFLGGSLQVDFPSENRQSSHLDLFYRPNSQNFRWKNPAKILAKNWAN